MKVFNQSNTVLPKIVKKANKIKKMKAGEKINNHIIKILINQIQKMKIKKNKMLKNYLKIMLWICNKHFRNCSKTKIQMKKKKI